jgi:eukaryotic-like serine/threonine-protein kinase
MLELQDEDCAEGVRNFVRNNPDIEITQYIRRGLNGDVYFGKRRKMGDDVVLKFYWSHPNYDATEEAVILKNIDHDNILKIYDLRFVPKNFAYFLTPKITGGDLQGIIDERRLSTKEALEIIAGILMGLTELHAKHHLVHRDLKPGNILIDLPQGIPIIADLGAVKKIDDANTPVSASKSTYYYLPPEAVVKDEYYYQSDIYQVGLIMFQVLGGYFPLNNPSEWITKKEQIEVDAIRNSQDRNRKFEEFIGKRITKGKLADASTLPYYLDPSFKRVIISALHHQHHKRFLNASLFLKEVHKLLQAHPNYLPQQDHLLIEHSNGRQFRIIKDRKDKYMVEKSIENSRWRKDNSHNGTLASILSLVRKT